MVVTKRNGENPSVRTSAFFLFFSSVFTACRLPGSVSRRKKVRRREKGRWVGGVLPPFWCSGFLKVRQALSGTFAT